MTLQNEIRSWPLRTSTPYGRGPAVRSWFPLDRLIYYNQPKCILCCMLSAAMALCQRDAVDTDSPRCCLGSHPACGALFSSHFLLLIHVQTQAFACSASLSNASRFRSPQSLPSRSHSFRLSSSFPSLCFDLAATSAKMPFHLVSTINFGRSR
jgi:hypothetical protein